MPASDIEKLRHWYSTHCHELSLSIDYRFPRSIDSTQVMLRLLRALPQCESLDEEDFLKWAHSWLQDECADELLRHEYSKLSLEEILNLVPKKRSNTKPMQVEEHSNNRTFIRVDKGRTTYVWVIPSDWLQVAAALWPVHIKNNRSGPYIAKTVRKQRLNGEWYSVDVPVHQIFLSALASEHIAATDGNFLNYWDGNLSLENDGTEDVSNPDAVIRSTPLRATDTADPTYAKPTPVRRHQERDTLRFSTSIRTEPVDRQAARIRRAWGV